MGDMKDLSGVVNTQALPLSSEPCPEAPDPNPGLQAVSWEPALKQGVKWQRRYCSAPFPTAYPKILAWKGPSLGVRGP